MPNDVRFVVCSACGVINEEAQATIEQLQQDVANLERELRGKRSAMSRMQKDQMEKLTASKHYDAAKRVLGFWKNTLMPNAKELESVKRLKPVIDRLSGGYSEHQLNMAAMGYKAFPFVIDGRRSATGPADRKYVDVDLIYRDAKHVDQGLRLWERHMADEIH
jgi:hypothetical protein